MMLVVRGFAERLAKKTDIDSAMGLRARKIEILAPINGGGVYAFDVPQELKVIWQAPEKANIEKYKALRLENERRKAHK